MAEPSEEEIRQVVDITGLNPVDDRKLVISALKNNSRNLDNVITKFYDDEGAFRRQYGKDAWDDSMFSADRDGSQGNAGISFHIEAPEHEAIQGVTPPGYAPSRPPSRTDTRSPLGKVVDWSASQTAGVTNSRSQEDEDMERALRESAQEAGISMSAQESGVADSTQPYFGPATRQDYDHSAWAMVPTNSSVGQTHHNVPAASSRKRPSGAPGLLVSGSRTKRDPHMLGGLLTTFHEIPMVRNALLAYGGSAASYGHHGQWWNGQTIQSPEVETTLDSDDVSEDQLVPAPKAFQQELHRLMAFLDSSERGYATVEPLTDLVPDDVGYGSMRDFWEHLGVTQHEALKPLMQAVMLDMVEGDETPTPETCTDRLDVGLIEIEQTQEDYQTHTTLYEVLDHMFWTDVVNQAEVESDDRMSFFEDTGEVLTFRFREEGPVDSLEIPLEFYPERYLTTRKREAKMIQQGWRDTKFAKQRALVEHRDLMQTVTSKGAMKDTTALFKEIEEQWSTFSAYVEGSSKFRKMVQCKFDMHVYPTYRKAPADLNEEEGELHGAADQVVNWAAEVLTGLQGRVQELRTELNHIERKQRFLGKLLTQPDKNRPKPMTCKRYLLRGVCATPEVVYVCRRNEGDLIDLGDAPTAQDQWWKLTYTANSAQPVTAEQVEVERVLRETWQYSKTPMFIYATETALNAPRDPLAQPLERFVQADNRSFRRELETEVAEENANTRVTVDPMSPSKRKHRDSMDSMDSAHVSVGSSTAANAADDDKPGGVALGFEHSDLGTTTGAVNGGSMDYRGGAGGSNSTEEIGPAMPPRPASRQQWVDVASLGGESAAAGGERAPEMQEVGRAPAFVTSLSRQTSQTGDDKS